MRAETFEIRWHDTQPIYSCSFQPIAANHLRRVLDHNKAQAAGLEPGKVLAESSASTSAAVEPEASTSRQPALPLSAQGQSWRFATAGGDNHARIWVVHPNIPSPAALAAAAQTGQPIAKHPPRVEYRATLRRHSGVVNCVRFCPKGELLATTGDDGMVLLWIPSDGPSTSFGAAFDDDGDAEFAKEHWRLRTMSRASSSEIYDMAWAPSGDSLVIGGTDFVARIVNAGDGTVLREISEHSHYIQGVAWDPLSEYIATQSSDRSVHVHHLQGRTPSEVTAVQTVSRNSKMEMGHRRQTSNSGSHFVWDPNSRPPVKRRASSHASDSERETSRRSTGRQTHRSSTPMEVQASASSSALASAPYASSSTAAGPPTTAATPASSSSASGPIARAATPTLHQSPAVHQSAMNPPQRTPSRRSSFNGSAIGSPPTSATSVAASQQPSLFASGAGATPAKAQYDRPRSNAASRSASRTRGLTPRSPSPAPPLPAIRAPPSPKQRMAALQASAAGGAMARFSMRLYGDENFSGFFRRLSFSPDGALLATPTGIFETISMPANNAAAQAPCSPTMAAHPRTAAISESASPQSPGFQPHGAASQAAPQAPHAPPTHQLRNTVYLYARGNLHKSNAPIAHLPGHKTATLAVKFSPVLYELRRDAKAMRASDEDGIPPHPTIPLEAGKQKTVSLERSSAPTPTASGVPATDSHEAATPATGDESDSGADTKTAPTSAPRKALAVPSMIGLPYRMIFAVATHDSVWIYDTQQGGPLCCFSNMHYASFTDLTWSPDGQTLMMCSTDGYCSGVVFDYGELGTPYTYSSQPSLQSSHLLAKSHAAGSPTVRRSSAQSGTGAASASHAYAQAVAASHTPQATPPQSFASAFPLAPQPPSTETSPGLGFVIGTPTAAAAAGAEKSALAREIDPPVIPEAPAAVSAQKQGEAAATTTAKADDAAATRKKRRIAPTLEGPIGS